MSTFYHHPRESEVPAISREFNDLVPEGYAVIRFDELSCFPSEAQVLQLRAALDSYIDQWIPEELKEAPELLTSVS